MAKRARTSAAHIEPQVVADVDRVGRRHAHRLAGGQEDAGFRLGGAVFARMDLVHEQVAQPDPLLAGANAALTTLSADLAMVNNAFAGPAAMPDVVHSHTWYTGMAGHLTALLHGIPHVLTAHSLEPRRPWKAEQLGGGYRVSSWAEKTAYEAADAVNQGVCSVAAVDAAMQKGVNYPRGPLAWADRVGLPVICSVLSNLARFYGEDRYRVSPLIQQRVLAGKNIHD